MATNDICKTLYVDASNLYGGISEILKPGGYVNSLIIYPTADSMLSGISQGVL